MYWIEKITSEPRYTMFPKWDGRWEYRTSTLCLSVAASPITELACPAAAEPPAATTAAAALPPPAAVDIDTVPPTAGDPGGSMDKTLEALDI